MGEKLNIGDICTRTTVFAYKDMTVSEAAYLMLKKHVGSLVVVEEVNDNRTIVGMLTDRDIVVAVVARDFTAHTTRVADVMSSSIVTCGTEDSMTDVLRMMQRHGIRRVPVTNAQGALVGIVTLDDLLEIVAENLQSFVQIIESETRREAHVRG